MAMEQPVTGVPRRLVEPLDVDVTHAKTHFGSELSGSGRVDRLVLLSNVAWKSFITFLALAALRIIRLPSWSVL